MGVMKRGLWNRLKSRQSKNGSASIAVRESWYADLEDDYPNCREFLLGQPGPEGCESGTVQFFVDHQGPKLRLCDRQHGQVAFLSGISGKDLLRHVEDGLKDDSIQWRIDQYSKRKGTKSKG